MERNDWLAVQLIPQGFASDGEQGSHLEPVEAGQVQAGADAEGGEAPCPPVGDARDVRDRPLRQEVAFAVPIQYGERAEWLCRVGD
jgi:hypothetical protein